MGLLAQIRAQIKVDLDLAVGPTATSPILTAQTYDYFRNPRQDSDVDLLFNVVAGGNKGSAIVNGNGGGNGGGPYRHVWMVTMAGANPHTITNSYWQPGRGVNQEFGISTWHLYGYLASNDASATEKVWIDVVESVITAFRADKKLNGIVIECDPLEVIDGMGVDKMLMFPPGEGGALSHYAKCELRAKVKLEG